MQYSFVKWEPKDSFEKFITLKQCPNWFERLLGEKEEEFTVYGSCTVWYYYPSCRRCSTSFDIFLSQINEQIKNGLLENKT